MHPKLAAIREQQQRSWNRVSNGWRKWDEVNMNFLRPIGNEIIRLIQPAPDEFILDVAAGTGEPGLSIAAMEPNCKVMITDLSEDMLKVARQNASNKGILNIDTLACDVCELPFEDNSFDAISCRFGFMFFPDMQLAAKEMYRVLKPGGRLAASVWNVPEKNFWITAIVGTINKNMDIPPPAPDAPGIFRCAKPQLMTDIFKAADLSNISSTQIDGRLRAGNAGMYWEMMLEVGAPIVAALVKADDSMKAKVKTEVFALLNEKYPDGHVEIDSSALVIYGEKQTA
jgi:ubiquinone/menaquinone biosynthesis C-methylase UbiE